MKRRILHVLASPHLGGAEWLCLYLAREQISLGHDVRIMFFEPGQASSMAQEMRLPLTIQNVTSYSRSARWEGYSTGLRRHVQANAPDVVHSHVPLANLICHRTLPRLKIPWVCTIHGSWKQFAHAPQTVGRPYLKPYLISRHALGDRFATRSAARIAAISDYVKSQLTSIQVSSRRISVVHDGLPPLANPLPRATGRERLALPQDAMIVGSLGFFAPVKGFDLLVSAFARVAGQHPGALLLIAGGDVMADTAYRRKLEKLVDGLRLSDRIRLLGGVNPKEGFLSALDIFVVASRTEGFSLSLVQAMQHGLPSVVTSAGGCREAARPDHESLVFASGNVDKLADNLDRMLRDDSLRQTFAQSSRQRADSYLTMSRCAADYDAFYAEALPARS